MATQTQMIDCPQPADTTDLHFKLVKRISVCSYGDSKQSFVNLLAVANAYGLTFIGVSNGFYAVKTNSICETALRRKFHQLTCQVSHVAVNSDDSYLAIGAVLSENSTCIALIYAIESIAKQGNVAPVHKAVLSSIPGVSLVDLVWNPAIPNLLSCCLTDGSIIVLAQIESGLTEKSLPPAAGARCLCWSPKGKQLVVGGEDGKLTQYRPDLTPAKTLPAPQLFNGNVSVVSIFWISNFQFAAYYRNRSDHHQPPVLLIINTEKNQPVTFVNYQDVTFGANSFRCSQFYFNHISAWNVMVISSANSAEVAVLSLEQNNRWKQWIVGDSSRAEMPLSATQDETFPFGMAIDMSNQSAVAWGEASLPPMPRLLLLSSEGTLCAYNVVALMPAAANLTCTAPSLIPPDCLFDAPVTSGPVTPAKPANSTEAPKCDSRSVSSSPVPATAVQSQIHVFDNVLPACSDVMKAPNSDQTNVLLAHVKRDIESSEQPEIDESVIDNAIFDEMSAIDEDLLELASALRRNGSFALGPPEELKGAVRRLSELTDYSKKAENATNSQAEEIGELKMEALELRARIEDATLMLRRHTSHICNQMRRSQHVDPYTSNTLREILSLRTYIDSQISLVADHLDQQWQMHQRSCRKHAKTFMKTPFIEDVLKTLEIHKKLIVHQKGELDGIQLEMKKCSLKSQLAAMSCDELADHLSAVHNRAHEFSKLADSFLGLSMNDRGERLHADDLVSLVLEEKMQVAKSSELSAEQLTALLDRFEDAQVPQVSQVERFSEREAHRKKIAERMKVASERSKQQNLLCNLSSSVPLPEMALMNFEKSRAPATLYGLERGTSSESNSNARDFTLSVQQTSKPTSWDVASGQQINKPLLNAEVDKKLNVVPMPPSGSSTKGNKITTTPAFSSLAPANSLMALSSSKPNTSPATAPPSAFLPSKFSFGTVGSLNVTTGPQSPFDLKLISAAAPTNYPGLGMASAKPFGVTLNPIPSDLTSKVSGTPFGQDGKSIEAQPANDETEVSSSSSKSTVSPAQIMAASEIAPQSSAPVLAISSTSTMLKEEKNITSEAQERDKDKHLFNLVTSTEVAKSSKSDAVFFSSAASAPATSFASCTNKSPQADPWNNHSNNSTNLNSPRMSTAVTTSSAITVSLTAPAPYTMGAATFTAPTPKVTPVTLASSGLFAPSSVIKSSHAAATTTESSNPSLFGGSSAFASPVSNSVPAPTTLLSAAINTTTSSIFAASLGQATITTASSIFAAAENSSTKSAGMDQTANLFGQMLGGSSTGTALPATATAAAAATTAPANIFGQVASSQPAFGSGNNMFASSPTPTTSSASIFASTPANVFGQNPSIFGSSSNLFSAPSNSSSSIFGGSPLGSNVATQSFGQVSPTAFSSPSIQNQNIFGSGGTTFGSNQPVSSPSSISIFGGGGAFSGSGSGFSNVSSSAQQSGFASAPIFSKAAGSAFGSAPVFGGASPGGTTFGTSAFGSAPVFGGTSPSGSTFASAAVFSSPQKVFGSPGSTDPANTFGKSAGFEAASQSSVGFGNLAQMNGQTSGFGPGFPPANASSFGTQQTTPQSSSFGGSSFSSWR